MADTKISAGADPVTLVGTDKVPVARSASTTAYAATMTEVAAFASTGRAPLASPVFTGDPQAPTPPAGDADTSIATTAFVSAAVATSLHDVGRNYIHNSMFNIAQRGAGPFTTTGVYTLDRWRLDVLTDTASVAPIALGDAHRTAIGDEEATQGMVATVTGNAAAGAFTVVSQYVENIRRLAGKTVTISFWAWVSSGSPKIGVAGMQYFGTGGSPSTLVTINGTATPALTTTPTRYSIALTFPSVAGKTLGTNNDHANRLSLFFSSGATNNTWAGGIGVQSGTFVLWGVQLELGPTVTPLEKLDPVTQLQQCQRFYQVGFYATVGYTTGGSYAGGHYAFPVQMRGVPAVVMGSPVAADVSVAAASAPDMANQYGFRFVFTGTGSGSLQGSRYFTASADL